MRIFDYSSLKEKTWDSEIISLIAHIHEYKGRQEVYLKQKPEELEKLVEIAKRQSTEASNAIEGIRTTSTRLKQLCEEKTTPKNRAEEEILGYRDVLNTIHENYEYIPITTNYILQLHRDLYRIGARIIAICDSIDAITSNRCYRKAHNFDYCYEEIEKNLGKMYDPIVGIDVLDNWDEITSVVNR